MPSLQQSGDADQTTCSAPCRNAPSNRVAWFLLGCLAFLYLNRFTLPDTPIYRMGDELIYLENAVKMFDGQTLYRDFFQFTPRARSSYTSASSSSSGFTPGYRALFSFCLGWGLRG